MLHTRKHIQRKVLNKIYHDKRCQRICKKRNNGRVNKKVSHFRVCHGEKFTICAPAKLSLFDATNESLHFFNEVCDTILHCGLKCSIYFDLSQIITISPDAIMYLIAIINNTKRIQLYDIECKGNMPEETKARTLFQEVGFYKFVSSKYKCNISENNKYMKIHNGINADGSIAGNFCDFVHNNSKQTYLDTKSLYTMIVELMTNTFQHAYQYLDDKPAHVAMYSNWYLYAQDMNTSVKFIFLDTGIGIPKTVSKRFREKLQEQFGAEKDSHYLESALTGEYARTETGLRHRGKGLPGIYEDCKKGAIQNLKIISGSAICDVGALGQISTINTVSAFKGTLFSWEILK